jgi:hypothetical protein
MKIITFECEDDYEAEKLASLVSVQKDGTVWVTGVAAVVGNEVVLQLKDRSSHSVVLGTDGEAKKLEHLLSDVIGGRVVIRASARSGKTAEVTID